MIRLWNLFVLRSCSIVSNPVTEGDLYEDGLTMRNGFFRTRHFNKNGSEAGSLDLFADDHHSDGGEDGMAVENVVMEMNSQAEAKRRKDRLEREEFMRKFRVSHLMWIHVYSSSL